MVEKKKKTSASARATADKQEDCAKQIITSLARRAYRRPVSGDEVQTLMAFYETGRKEGTFDAGIQFALERMLVDPDSLLRVHRAPAASDSAAGAQSAYRLSDLEVASRLSFFL